MSAPSATGSRLRVDQLGATYLEYLGVGLLVSLAGLAGTSLLGETIRQKILCAAAMVTNMRAGEHCPADAAPVPTAAPATADPAPADPATAPGDGIVLLTGDMPAITSNLVAYDNPKTGPWPPEIAKDLTWCVEAASCGDRADEMEAAVAQATKAWSDTGACIAFRHDCSQEARMKIKCDTLPGTMAGQTAAYGHDNPALAHDGISIDLSKAGGPALPYVVAHEIGHSLGFDHEQVHGESVCPQTHADNDQGTGKALTPYDTTSVMHYECGKDGKNGGAAGRWISEKDADGAIAAYGKCNETVFAPPPPKGGNTYGRGAGWVPKSCPPGKENKLGLCYGGGGVGTFPICEAWAVNDAGLCYWPCVQGFHGVGPVCHKD